LRQFAPGERFALAGYDRWENGTAHRLRRRRPPTLRDAIVSRFCFVRSMGLFIGTEEA
jgi:hypothetical protein